VTPHRRQPPKLAQLIGEINIKPHPACPRPPPITYTLTTVINIKQ
jgi:hypothetical protein